MHTYQTSLTIVIISFMIMLSNSFIDQSDYLFAATDTKANSTINYTLPDLADWQISDKHPDDIINIEQTDDILQISYSMTPQELLQVANNTYHIAKVRLLLKQPQILAADIKQIRFDAKGLHTQTRQGKLILLQPLLADASGETFVYRPKMQDHLENGTSNWSGWTSGHFFATEAGGSAEGTFTASGGDQSLWPEGELSFLGFELSIRLSKNPSSQKGTILLGGYNFSPAIVPHTDPYAYTDAFFQQKGEYRFEYQIFDNYQATPLREHYVDISYDPTIPALTRQKIVFDLGADGNYWIRYQIVGSNSQVQSPVSLRAWVENSQKPANSQYVDLATPPILGYLRLNPGHERQGVYTNREKAALTIRAFSKGQDKYRISWKIRGFVNNDIYASGDSRIDFTDHRYQEQSQEQRYQDLKIALDQLPVTLSAYRLLTTVYDAADKIIDSQSYDFGFISDLSVSYNNRAGKRQTREDIKKKPYNRVSYLRGRNVPPLREVTLAEATDHFIQSITQIVSITPNITYCLENADFMVLPGIYDFTMLDQVMDNAWDYGARITVRLSHADHNGQNMLTWQHYNPQRNSDGTINYGHRYYGSFSVADSDYIATWLQGHEAIYQRYKEHPAFQGYQIFEVAGEWAVLDSPWNGAIVSYEKVAVSAFISYLRQIYQDDLAALARAWGEDIVAWDSIKPPQPDFSSGAKPDLRKKWLDFCKFKHHLDTKVWLSAATRDIRRYDPDSTVIVYSLDPGGFEDSSGVSDIDYLHNGGNHFLRGEGSLLSAWQNSKIGWITEPHMPHRWAAYGDRGDSGWLLDWTTYIMLAQAGGGGVNMHVYYWPIPGDDLNLTAHYGREYAFDRFQKWQPLLQELHGLQLQQDKIEIAVLQDHYTLFCKHRTIFEPRLDDLRRWYELLKNDSLDYQDYRPDNAADYKLLLPNILDEVMSNDNITLIADFVKNGGKCIISALTGSLSPDNPEMEYGLLAALGIAPPTQPFITVIDDPKQATAQIVSDNPFFTVGTELNFYTLTNLRQEETAVAADKTFFDWPYRWLPQTDYFRIYPGHKLSDATSQVLAQFADGGVALSLHKVGSGEVLVFWGSPDYSITKLAGFMQKAAAWAGVNSSRQGNPVPLTLQGKHGQLERYYAIMYQDRPGEYKQKLPIVPDGDFFVDDMVLDQRFGVFSGEELRTGVSWQWQKGLSPLKVLRIIPKKSGDWRWVDKYR